MALPDHTKGMTCSILEPKDIGNCSANGISKRYSRVVVTDVCAAHGERDGSPAHFAAARGAIALDEMRIFSPKPEGDPYAAAEVTLVVRHLFGRGVYVHAEPADGYAAKHWAMMGGCYIETSDSRWSDMLRAIHGQVGNPGFQTGPIPLHDRYER